MTISHIPNIERQEAFHIKGWIGWQIGWWTGWHNPFDRYQDLVNPAELGRLVRIQGEFMQEQARLMGEQGRIVQNLGERLSEVIKADQPTGQG
jgi:hypothetical protein